MIPIKKLKKQIVCEFKKAEVMIELKIQSLRIANKLTGHYLNVPWGFNGAIITIRWNVKRERFDRISFIAFGKNHRIKL